VYEATKVAIDVGYRHIDEAWIYSNEDEVGRALEEKIASGAVKREDMFITSKLWNNFHRPELVKKGVQESLAQLRLSHLDLFLIHFPVSFRPDVTEATSADEVEAVPLEDTWRAMEALVDEGLVKNIGVSNFEIEHLQRILAVATKPIAVNQFETQPYYQRAPLVAFCQAHGIVVTAHTSLGSPGNVMKGHHASPPLMQDPVVNGVAAEVGRAPANVLLRWAVQRGTIVLPKSVTAARIAANADIFSFELSDAQMAAINGLDKPGLEGCFNREWGAARGRCVTKRPPPLHPRTPHTRAHTHTHHRKQTPRRHGWAAASSSPASPRTTTSEMARGGNYTLTLFLPPPPPHHLPPHPSPTQSMRRRPPTFSFSATRTGSARWPPSPPESPPPF
jgi:diketogulonate reductase-like aldo/keto reductase